MPTDNLPAAHGRPDREEIPVITPRLDPMPPSSTIRVMAVLDALVRAPDGTVGVRELAGALLMSRSATHRILATLADLGVARSLDVGRYRLTARPRSWAYFLSVRHPVLTAARPVMEKLAADAGESVHLLAVSPVPSIGLFVASADGPNPVQHTVPIGVPSPLTAGAGGKAILSAVDEQTLADVLRTLARTDPARAGRLRTELASVRRTGYATSTSELLSDTAGVAAPFRRFGRVFGSLTISMPAYRQTAARQKEHALLVRDAAAQLDELLAREPAP